jgi:hypothetical protein
MNTGARRHRVTLTTGDDAVPLSPPDWWGAFLTEATPGQATLIGPYHPGITTATRVHFKGRVFHVDAISNREERDAELVLSLSEVFA